MISSKPDTLEGRWDILYRDYPEIYEEWGKIEKKPDLMALLNDHFAFTGKKIADIGSGSGISTIDLTKYSDSVVGIEIEDAMNTIAASKAQAAGVNNVQFKLGDAECIPLENCSVDVAIAIMIAGGDIQKVAQEMERIIKPGGMVIRVDCAPGWFGYELARPYWRQGIMTEALTAITRVGFIDMGLNRIEAVIMPENHATIMLLEKLGFHIWGIRCTCGSSV
jgi:ubiquinone/menaquinone biosynthesis C-methylase UbiE